VSAVEVWRRDFLEDVQTSLRETGLEARCLELELTEDTLMRDTALAIPILQALNDLGAHVAIDHFGIGHSSLSDLQQFPFDVLKVDQSFVQEIATGVTDAPILMAIIGLGKSLNHRVMAAGVETDWQLSFLQARQCPEAQGYLFSPPVRAEQLGGLLGTDGSLDSDS
jgi:EAL domain-containing protein (putative c-di-GMP-specific phosphodiesterase class I)